MSTVRMRPTFRVSMSVDRDTAIERIRGALGAQPEFAGRWRGKGRWAELFVPHAERRLWSPHLSIRLDEDGPGCTLFGRFAPHPEVWTFFMFLYFGLAFAVVFGGVLGYVQWASNEPAWGLWTVPTGLTLIGLIHAAGWTGQRLGQEQMVSLKADLDGVLAALGLTRSEPSPPVAP